MPVGKSILALLRSLPDVISLQEIAKADTRTDDLYTAPQHAFKNVAEIKNGKQKRQTLKELIDEL